MNKKESKVIVKTIDGVEVKMVQRSLAISGFKVLDDNAGIFEAHVSMFGNVDSYGEIVDKGAFVDWLKQYFDGGKKRYPKGVWAHNWDEPICATLECYEDEVGLYVKGQFVLEVQRAKETYALMKAGVITDFSFGFQVLEDGIDPDTQMRHLKKIAIYEYSPVLVGANRDAELISVKSGVVDEKADESGSDSGAASAAAEDEKDDSGVAASAASESGADAESGENSAAAGEAKSAKRSVVIDMDVPGAKHLFNALEAIMAIEDVGPAKSTDTSPVEGQRGRDSGSTKVLRGVLRDARKADKLIESIIVRAKLI